MEQIEMKTPNSDYFRIINWIIYSVAVKNSIVYFTYR